MEKIMPQIIQKDVKCAVCHGYIKEKINVKEKKRKKKMSFEQSQCISVAVR